MNPRLQAALFQFVIAGTSLFALVQVIKVIGGTPFLPLLWQDIAMPIGAAAIFSFARFARSGNTQ